MSVALDAVYGAALKAKEPSPVVALILRMSAVGPNESGMAHKSDRLRRRERDPRIVAAIADWETHGDDT